jgi:hypothetical protein
MRYKLEYEGICAVCKSAPHCVFLKGSQSPIMQCEEFESFSPVKRKKFDADNPQQAKTLTTTTTQDSDTPKHKGLCINCKNSEKCSFPKPEGGVWRCEEYE